MSIEIIAPNFDRIDAARPLAAMLRRRGAALRLPPPPRAASPPDRLLLGPLQLDAVRDLQAPGRRPCPPLPARRRPHRPLPRTPAVSGPIQPGAALLVLRARQQRPRGRRRLLPQPPRYVHALTTLVTTAPQAQPTDCSLAPLPHEKLPSRCRRCTSSVLRSKVGEWMCLRPSTPSEELPLAHFQSVRSVYLWCH